MDYVNKRKISQWAEEERPREKLLLKGRNALSNVELLAILIGSGPKNETAVDVARHLLNRCNGSLHQLALQTAEQLKAVRGIGDAAAARIGASLELGRRKRAEKPEAKTKLQSSDDVFELIQEDLADLTHEEFWVVLLNNSNVVIKKICISKGGFSRTVADPKKVFSLALENRSSAIIVCHNHPSGNIKPSDEDLSLTKKLVNAGILLDMPVIDHIIVGSENFFSFVDNGLL